MLPSPDSAETAKTTTPFRGWAAVAAEFPSRGADIISADETNSSPNRSRLQLFVNTVGLFLTLDHSFSIRSVRTLDIIHCDDNIDDVLSTPSRSGSCLVGYRKRFRTAACQGSSPSLYSLCFNCQAQTCDWKLHNRVRSKRR